jgi:hypothetical protein
MQAAASAAADATVNVLSNVTEAPDVSGEESRCVKLALINYKCKIVCVILLFASIGAFVYIVLTNQETQRYLLDVLDRLPPSRAILSQRGGAESGEPHLSHTHASKDSRFEEDEHCSIAARA